MWLTVAMYNAQTWLREEFADAYVHLAGKAKKPSPYGKGKDESEETALNTGPNDPCNFIKRAIEILEAQIAWRQSDLIAHSDKARGHLERIRVLQKHLDKLKSAYNLWCKK